jgi:hypothetical protein
MAQNPKVEKLTPCARGGHHYLPLPQDKPLREQVGPNVHLFTVFYCDKCAEIVTRKTGEWKNFTIKTRAELGVEKSF